MYIFAVSNLLYIYAFSRRRGWLPKRDLTLHNTVCLRALPFTALSLIDANVFQEHYMQIRTLVFINTHGRCFGPEWRLQLCFHTAQQINLQSYDRAASKQPERQNHLLLLVKQDCCELTVTTEGDWDEYVNIIFNSSLCFFRSSAAGQ